MASPIHDDILSWSTTRPAWQRDALRRIVGNGILSDADVAELHYLCGEPHDALDDVLDLSAGSGPEKEIVADPLHAQHLPTTGGPQISVSLIRLGGLTNVNRLSKQTAIEFGSAPGLTVVYGNNGAGKSGYARVIRKACRTRGTATPIEPNAFVNAPPLPASAEFTITVNGQVTTLQWVDGQPSDSHLGRILFFDGTCAEHHVHEDGATSFVPNGLDVLTKLTQACDTLRNIFAERVRQLQTLNRTASANWKVHGATKVATLISGLTAITDQTKVAALANWTAAAEARLDEVRLLLASDPEQKSKQTQAVAKRIHDFALDVRAHFTALSTSAAATLAEAAKECDTAYAAHHFSTAASFDDQFLAGTGSDLWRELWKAARAYSLEQAYPEQPFPYTDDGARCVLCQTPYSEAAEERMKRFAAYLENATLHTLTRKQATLAELRLNLERLPDLEKSLSAVSADLASHDAELSASLTSTITSLRTRASELVTGSKEAEQADRDILPLPADPCARLDKLERDLTQQAADQASLHDPVARQTLQKERDELEDRQWLQANSASILEQIERLKSIARLEAAQADTNTAQITAKATSLNKAIVTKALCEGFAAELKDLGLKTISVELRSAGGQKGTLRFGVRLPGINNSMVSRIASEGEKRCIGLALFLAELSQAHDSSALVLDDPVSSLDHLHCHHVAKRIAKEALVRQVIVFTHNPLFLHDLQTSANEQHAAVDLGYLQWNGDTPGDWVSGLPWDWKSVKDRFDGLYKKANLLASTVSTQLSEEDKAAIRQAYSWLRGTLERIVETKIFNGAVQRFSNYVNIKSVEKVVGFSRAEFDELKRLFAVCSDVTEAHDNASGANKAVPLPDQLKQDIAAAEHLVAMVTARQKTIA